MQEDIIHYFQLEQSGMIYLFSVGCFSLLVSLGLFKFGGEIQRPSAWLFVVAAVVQLIVSVAVYLRSASKTDSLLAMWHENPDEMVLQELTRVSAVLERFTYIKGLEVLLVVISLVLLVRLKSNKAWRLFFAGLLLQMMAMFCVDYLAEYRANVYFESLKLQALEMSTSD